VPGIGWGEFALELPATFNDSYTPDGMTLNDIVAPEHIITELSAKDRWEALDEMVDRLVECGSLKAENRDAVIDVVKKRESQMSTGIGFGIAIPHATTDLIDEVVGALGRSKEGIDFDALDNQPVSLVVLFLVPQGQFQKHLHTLATIAKQLHNKQFRESVENAPDAAAINEILGQPLDRA